MSSQLWLKKCSQPSVTKGTVGGWCYIRAKGGKAGVGEPARHAHYLNVLKTYPRLEDK